MKILVLSDTHIPFSADDLPCEIYQKMKEVDLVIHAGDFVSMEFLNRLKKCAKVEAVYGNMDSSDIRKQFSKEKIIEAGNFRIGILHGEGSKEHTIDLAQKCFKNQKVDLVVFGHTHQAVSFTKAGVIYLNPGSPTDSIFAASKTYGLVEIDGEIKVEIVKL